MKKILIMGLLVFGLLLLCSFLTFAHQIEVYNIFYEEKDQVVIQSLVCDGCGCATVVFKEKSLGTTTRYEDDATGIYVDK